MSCIFPGIHHIVPPSDLRVGVGNALIKYGCLDLFVLGRQQSFDLPDLKVGDLHYHP